jgi:hypothetical protein
LRLSFFAQAFTYAGCGLIALVCLNTLIISWTLRTTLSIVSTGRSPPKFVISLNFFAHALLNDAIAVLLGYFLRGALFDTSQDFSWYISEQRRTPLLHPPIGQAGSKEPSTTFEGAEWLNGLLDVAWPVIDQQLFATAMDLIEDEMKAMTPGIVVGSF